MFYEESTMMIVREDDMDFQGRSKSRNDFSLELNEIESCRALRYTEDRLIGLDTLKQMTTMMINDASNRKDEISRGRHWPILYS